MAVQYADEWLMKEVAGGERASLDILVRRHAGPLLTFLTRMTGNRHAAEEIFQDTFLAIWKNRRQFKGAKRFKPWMYTIAINRLREIARKKSIPLNCLNPNDLVDSNVLSSPGEELPVPPWMIAEAVASLTENQRLVLVLRIWSHLEYAEIAQIADCRETTVRSHMSHALEAMRNYLEARVHEQKRENIQ